MTFSPPYTTSYLMDCSTSFAFEPHSVYLLFVKLDGWCGAGVFHHKRDNKGRLAYAGGEIPGSPSLHRRVFLFERDLKQGKGSPF